MTHYLEAMSTELSKVLPANTSVVNTILVTWFELSDFSVFDRIHSKETGA